MKLSLASLVCAVGLVVVASATTAFSLEVDEPGLTCRVAQLALLKLPETARSKMAPHMLSVMERLQSRPPVAVDDRAAQIELIFRQASEGNVGPELLASLARAVVGLSLPASGSEMAALRSHIALVSQLEEIQILQIPSASEPSVFARDLKRQGQNARDECVRLTGERDSAALEVFRRKCASSVVANVAGAWVSLLEKQKPLASSSMAAPTAGVGSSSLEQPAFETQPSGSVPRPGPPLGQYSPNLPDPGPQTPVLPVLFVGNKISKKFHRLDCRFLPAEDNQVPFPSREEALRAGFVPCRVCKP
ncbi:MAG: hypothetical protein KatS3mg024_0893 [Armatimonadota bacterium]|nr:MAG: hypothetical protein KatS3mg024_0893 [Armatimonadota bacterium]